MRLSAICVAACAAVTAAYPKPLGFYMALQSTGIIEVAFDPSKEPSSSLSIIRYNTNAGHMPGWLTSYRDKVYSISRTEFPDAQTESGGVFAFQKPTVQAPPGTNLTLLDQETSHGEGGVHVDVSPDGRTLAATNIDGSTVAINILSPGGEIGDATYVFKYNLTTPGPGTNESQEIANPHQSVFDPTGQFLFVPDRGSDRFYVYQVQGPQQVILTHNISVPAGSGPRHVTFSPRTTTSNYGYLINELSTTVLVLALDYGKFSASELVTTECIPDLQITLGQTISILGKGLPPSPPINRDLAAEIAVSNDGKFVYASNRNTITLDSDIVAIFSANPDPAYDAQHLTYLGFNQTLGKTPRNFALSNDADNKWVAVANQLTQDVTVFERDLRTGFFKEVRGRISLGELDLKLSKGPMCILWT